MSMIEPCGFGLLFNPIVVHGFLVGVAPVPVVCEVMGVHVKPGETEIRSWEGGHTKSSPVKSGQPSPARFVVSHQTKQAASAAAAACLCC